MHDADDADADSLMITEAAGKSEKEKRGGAHNPKKKEIKKFNLEREQWWCS